MKQNIPKQLPVVINDCHQLLAWIIPQLDHFPRSRRFTLGEKLEMLLLEVLSEPSFRQPEQEQSR